MRAQSGQDLTQPRQKLALLESLVRKVRVVGLTMWPSLLMAVLKLKSSLLVSMSIVQTMSGYIHAQVDPSSLPVTIISPRPLIKAISLSRIVKIAIHSRWLHVCAWCLPVQFTTPKIRQLTMNLKPQSRVLRRGHQIIAPVSLRSRSTLRV